jgi:Zn-dependent protease
MTGLSPTIGKIFGIDIELHWTFVLLLVLAFVVTYPGLYGFVIVVLLFACVLLHELAHSVTSKVNGIDVKKIVLLPIGGASIINLDDITPKLSFYIALAGPMSSLLLGLVFGIGTIFAPGGMILQTLQLLFLLNILLGLGNLLPAFPLDGGRVLKSYLQEKRSSLDATKIAVKASNAVLVLLIAGTIVYAAWLPGATFFYREFVVLWTLIIVMFLYGGAKSELQSAYVLEYATGLHAYDAASKNFLVITPHTTMRQLYRKLLDEKAHIAVFRRGNKIRVVTRLVANPLGRSSGNMMSKDVMSFSMEIPQTSYDAPLSDAIKKIRYEEAPLVAVTKKGRIVGVLLEQHVEQLLALHMPQIMAKEEKS